MVLLLFLTPSSLKSSSLNERIGIIYINGSDGSYTMVTTSIDVSCDVWWQNNLIIEDRLDPQLGQNHYIHTINGKPVIGHICNP